MEPCNTENNFKFGADLRYSGCRLIRSSMVFTPARRDIYITSTINRKYMPSTDFEKEKSAFREFYEQNSVLLNDAKDSYCALINALVTHSGSVAVSKIEGRVKDKEECIRKFSLKYRQALESTNTPYEIRDHISDLIGIRVVCLYEDEIETVRNILQEHLDVLDVTDKIAAIESTESSFGYKGLHLDLKLSHPRTDLPEYKTYTKFSFEIQIRTIIQDSWSVLDHKIKYKRSIPNNLKRRINTLAALFELADREFKEIRNATKIEVERAELSANEAEQEQISGPQPQGVSLPLGAELNAFTFLKIALHFFRHYEFEAQKVDGFVEEIVRTDPKITRSLFNFYLRENLPKVKKYKIFFETENQNSTLNPYTMIRHCLYLGNKEHFSSTLTNIARDAFDKWLSENESHTTTIMQPLAG